MTFDATCTSGWKERSARSPYVCHRTDGRTDGQASGQMEREGNAELLSRAAPGKGRRMMRGRGRRSGVRRNGGSGVAVVRLRRNYPFSCVFIFRVITNEVNRNRTKLILLSVEKSHRRLSVHPPSPPQPFSARDLSASGDADATRRVCATLTQAGASAPGMRRFRRW